MAEQRINTGATHAFPAGVVDENMDLDNRHGVDGNVLYQIAGQPAVQIPFNNNNHVIHGVNGQAITVTNNLPNSLYCIY